MVLYGSMLVKDLDELTDGISTLYTHVIEKFFDDSAVCRNFATLGLRLPLGPKGLSLGQTNHFHLKTGRMICIQDERAFKFMLTVKGSSGTRPCFKCVNVVANLRIEAADDLQDMRTCKFQDCILHTNESFYKMTEELTAAASTTSATDFERLEQAFGLNHRPRSLLWHHHHRKYFHPVIDSMFDPMHCILGSGEIN